MSVVKGSDLMLFKKVGEGDSATYEAMGAATNHTLDASRELLETANKDTGIFGDNEAGKVTWSIGVEAMMVMSDYDGLMEAFLSGTKLMAAFAIASNADSVDGKPAGGWKIGNDGYEGEVLITALNAAAPYNDKATYTATLTGCGPLKKRNGSSPASNLKL
ncbi:phage tail tube protein [Parabacteroides goldsteinii]|uniref:phage tail tube protein n=1 Tax=Parabacteroides goldsteinii TaxID=328812 RepID=UPI0026711FCF|nr:phage tail tube protein [Parabacteroides goldsteinii]